MLSNGDCAEQLEWLIDHYRRYSKPPSIKAFRARFKKVELIAVADSLDYLIDEVRNRRALSMLEQGMYEATELMEHAKGFEVAHDVRDVLQRVLSEALIETAPTSDVDLTKNGAERLKLYDDRRKNPGALLGVTTGFKHLDRVTGGLQPEQLITFVGAAKAGKSTMIMNMALQAQNGGTSVLLVGYEMANGEQAERYDSLVSGLNIKRIQFGHLDDEEFDTLKKAIKRRSGYAPLTLVADPTGTSTLSSIAAKIAQYKPGLVIVDGVYMMQDEIGNEPPGTPRHLTNITRGMKRLAQSTKLPIVITTQVLNWKLRPKQGLTADAIGYSSSFVQDSDIILGVENQPDREAQDPDGVQHKQARVLLARNSRNTTVRFTIDWRIGQIQEYDADDMTDDMAKGIEAIASFGLAAPSEYQDA